MKNLNENAIMQEMGITEAKNINGGIVISLKWEHLYNK